MTRRERRARERAEEARRAGLQVDASAQDAAGQESVAAAAPRTAADDNEPPMTRRERRRREQLRAQAPIVVAEEPERPAPATSERTTSARTGLFDDLIRGDITVTDDTVNEAGSSALVRDAEASTEAPAAPVTAEEEAPADAASTDEPTATLSTELLAEEEAAAEAEADVSPAPVSSSQRRLRSRTLARRRRHSPPVPSTTRPSRDVQPASKPRKLRRGILSMSVMGFVAAIAFATSIPTLTADGDYETAAAENTKESEPITAAADPAPTPTTQSLQGDGATLAPVESDKYTSRTLDEVAQMYHIRTAATYTNDPNGDIQWPFPVGVPVSDFYGYRTNPAGFHHGVDFTPGVGSDIHVIADGTVRLVGLNPNDGLGIHVIVDHVIDGQKVSSVYAHMMPGTVTVTPGEKVSVTDVLGEVGSTGFSTGPHLHFEIRLGGTDRVDPFAWMQEHAD